MEFSSHTDATNRQRPAGAADPSGFDPKTEIPGQLQKLLASPYFRHSERYRNFLRYIVDHSLEGRREMLKERMIGVEVLGKSPDFDTGNDTSVRVVANEVRKRLTLYYGTPEHQAEPQIRIPIRSYVAEFCMPEAADPAPEAVAEGSEEAAVEGALPPASTPDTVPARFGSLKRMQILLAGFVIVCALLWGFYALRSGSPLSDFWGPFLKDANGVTVCVSPFYGSDGATAPEPLTFDAGKSGSPLSYYAYRQIQNGMATPDVIAFSKIASFMQERRRTASIRSAHGTALSDLYGGPVILLGGFHNQWMVRFEAEHRFHCVRDKDNKLRWIEDKQNPGQRTWMIDDSAPLDKITVDYLLVSRVFHQPTGQWWMSVNGLTGVGTMVGASALTDPKIVAEITDGLPDGWKDKNFQMVLGFSVVDGSPGIPRRLSFYSW